MSTAPPGWHPQPDGRERFWDGQQWTDQFRQPEDPKQQGSGARVEFDVEGRTYRIEVEKEFEVDPYYFAKQKVNEVSRETDLLTGQEILVVWGKVGVIRKL